MAALKPVVQKHIEERRHFVFNLCVGWLWLAQKHLHELRCYITGDNLAVPPVIVLQLLPTKVR